MAKEQVILKCPCCGWRRPMHPTGGLARQRGISLDKPPKAAEVGHLDPEQEKFVAWQSAPGGRGGPGFPDLRFLTIRQAASESAWRPYVAQLVAWARRVVALGEELGL